MFKRSVNPAIILACRNADELKDYYEITHVFEQFIKEKNEYYKFNDFENSYHREWIKVFTEKLGDELKKVYDSSNLIAFNSKLNKYVDLDTNQRKHNGYSDFSNYLQNNYYDYFKNEITAVFKDISLDNSYVEMIWKGVCWLFSRNYVGILFAGYGKDNAFPKFIDVNIYGIIAGELKYDVILQHDEVANGPSIQSVAQPDVITTFCMGISNKLQEHILNEMDSVVKKRINDLSKDDFSDNQIRVLNTIFSGVREEIKKEIDLKIQNEEVNPLFNSIQNVQLSDLAFLSESLVNLTSLKRTYVLDDLVQTVGGPTDVAVISKSDGFIWIKRKHYFDKELNIDYVNKINN